MGLRISEDGVVCGLVTDILSYVQRGMLAQLAARLRDRQMGGAEGVGGGEGGGIVIDDNCEVSLYTTSDPDSCVVRGPLTRHADHVGTYERHRVRQWGIGDR